MRNPVQCGQRHWSECSGNFGDPAGATKRPGRSWEGEAQGFCTLVDLVLSGCPMVWRVGRNLEMGSADGKANFAKCCAKGLNQGNYSYTFQTISNDIWLSSLIIVDLSWSCIFKGGACLNLFFEVQLLDPRWSSWRCRSNQKIAMPVGRRAEPVAITMQTIANH